MPQMHVVIRPFEGERLFKPGEVVDIDGWRMGRQLVERRYIRPATVEELPQEAPRRSRGREVPNAE